MAKRSFLREINSRKFRNATQQKVERRYDTMSKNYENHIPNSITKEIVHTKDIHNYSRSKLFRLIKQFFKHLDSLKNNSTKKLKIFEGDSSKYFQERKFYFVLYQYYGTNDLYLTKGELKKLLNEEYNNLINDLKTLCYIAVIEDVIFLRTWVRRNKNIIPKPLCRIALRDYNIEPLNKEFKIFCQEYDKKPWYKKLIDRFK